MLKNQAGSILSVAFVVMAILTFSLSSLSVYTIRTIENTERTSQNAVSRNEAQRIISQAMQDFRKGTDEYKGIEQLLDENPEKDILGDEDDDNFIGDEDVGLISKVMDDYRSENGDTLLRIIEDDAMFRDVEDSEDFEEGIRNASFRFSYTYQENRNIVKYLHITNHGVEHKEYDAFEFSMGTNDNIFFNGGAIKQSQQGNPEELIKIYAGQLYDNYQAFELDNDLNFQEIDTLVDDKPTNYLHAVDGSLITNHYRRCLFDSDEECTEIDENGNLIINHDNFNRIGQDDGETPAIMENLFSGFDMDEHFFTEFNRLIEPSSVDNESITQSNYLDNLEAIFGQDDNSILSQSDFEEDLTLDENSYINPTDGTLEINDSDFELNTDGYTLFIDGDLEIQNINEINGESTIFVRGNVEFDGTDTLKMANSFMIYGDFIANFEEGSGMLSKDKDEGLSIFTKGNIEILHSESKLDQGNHHNGFFFFANDSIFINAANTNFRFGGAAYASGNGDGLERVQLRTNDSTTYFQGIFINSYFDINNPETIEPEYDRVNSSPADFNLEGLINPTDAEIYGYSGIGVDNDHNFVLRHFKDIHPGGGNVEERLRDSFRNVPDSFNTIVLYPNVYSFQTSTFRYSSID